MPEQPAKSSRHTLIGIVLFHTLFEVSPQAGQNLFGIPALGEYFRSVVAYGTIAFTLMFNLQPKRANALRDNH